MPPEARTRIGDCEIFLLGTVAGFVPDGARVRAAFESFRPDALALGIPEEDLASLRILADPANLAQLPEPDDWNARLLELLKRFGDVRVPSPDLGEAYALATAGHIPITAIDLGDMAHAEIYTRHVGMLSVLRSNRIRNAILAADFAAASDAYDLAARWDAEHNRIKAVAAVERMREEHMARQLRESAATSHRILAVLPSVRLAGVTALLSKS